MEVSSHALEQKRVFGIDFDVAIFTNLTRDHLDYHGTMDNYFAAKQKLFTALSWGTKKGAAVINIDDQFGARLAGTTQVEVTMTYGLAPAARLRATQIQLGREGSQFTLETPDLQLACQLPLIGRHNIYNALAAVGAGLVLKVAPRVADHGAGAGPARASLPRPALRGVRGLRAHR
jgi:UDP-N-acetylmuramoyl-L-alanyl-D-glutamate--2,6-diaminopimelate ligase